jgi:glycosyltransferase involved in cell wall biosynthesis
MTTLTVVIPAYNEERGISTIINRVLSIKEELKKINIESLELLVVNDGSGDQTCEIAQAIARVDPCLRVINHPKNRGYGAALKTGFSNAQGDLVGFLDADGTYPPEHFPSLCEAAMNGFDVVIGSRMMGTDSKMPLTRRIGNIFFAGLLSILGARRVTDSASGMRVFKRSIADHFFPLPDGLNLTPVMSARALHENLKIVEIPIPYSERVGASKLSVVHDGKIFLESMVWTVLSYNPVQIFGMIGIFLVLLSLLVVAGLVGVRLSGITSLGPWGVVALFSALVNGVVGISLFTLGVVSNYLVSLFYKRPIRQGLFGRPILNSPLELQFGWVGLGLFLLGLVFAVITLVLGLNGWDMNRIWLYLIGSALQILMGMQLMINWFLVRVLGELSQRSFLTKEDLQR